MTTFKTSATAVVDGTGDNQIRVWVGIATTGALCVQTRDEFNGHEVSELWIPLDRASGKLGASQHSFGQ